MSCDGSIGSPRTPTCRPVSGYACSLLLGYLALPFDPIPDFVPVLGYADDAIIVTVTTTSPARTTSSVTPPPPR
jgi:uncharacterized membrane protein YkvA (DUF1232 family)